MSSYRRSASPQRSGDPSSSRRPNSYIDMSPSTGLPTLPSLPPFAPAGGYGSPGGGGAGGLGASGLGFFGNQPSNSPPSYYGGSFYGSNSGIAGMGLQPYPSASQGLPPPTAYPSPASFDPMPGLSRRDSFGASSVAAGMGRRGSLSGRDSLGTPGSARPDSGMGGFVGAGAGIGADLGQGFGDMPRYTGGSNDPNIFASHQLPQPDSPALSRGTPMSGRTPLSPSMSQKGVAAPGSAGSTKAPGQKTARTYRKKTPPEACAVCATSQTPEWRKGPSGLRTLCNACGLTAAKQPQRDPQTIEEVWQQLTDIGINRFRGNYTLSQERKDLAAKTWYAAKESGQTPRVSNRSSYARSEHSMQASSSRGPQQPSGQPGFGGGGRPQSASRNPGDLEGAAALFSMARGRGASFSNGDSPAGSHPYAQVSGVDAARGPPPGGYASAAPNPPTMPGQGFGPGPSGRRNSLSHSSRMSISAMLNQEPPSRPSSAQSNRSSSGRNVAYR